MKEITFHIERDEIDGGFAAEALGYGIATQAETEEELKQMIIDAVKCHFFDTDTPKIINLHFVKNEVFLI